MPIDIKSVEIRDYVSVGALNSLDRLAGGIGSTFLAETEFYIHWETLSKNLTFFNDTITRNDGGSWFADEFKLSDIILINISPTYTGSMPGVNTGEFEIAGITDATIQLVPNGSGSGAGTIPFTTEVSIECYNVYGITEIKNINLLYELANNNNSSYTYTSLIDGELQKFNKINVNTGMSLTAMNIPTINKSWVTGISFIKGEGIGTSGVSTGYEQCFKIFHQFITPPFLEEFINGNILDSSLSYLNGNNNIKYAIKIEAGRANNTVDLTTDNGNVNSFIKQGSMGWFGTWRNTPLTTNYYIQNKTITANSIPVPSIMTGVVNTISFDVKSNIANITNNTVFEFWVLEMPVNYKNNTNNYLVNFDYSRWLGSVSTPDIEMNRILYFTPSVTDASTLNISLTYDANTIEKKYLIYVVIADDTQTDINSSDAMTVIIDFNESLFRVLIPDNFIDGNIQVNDHSSNDVSISNSDYKGWVMDEVLNTWNFRVATGSLYSSSSVSYNMQKAICEVWAVNTNDEAQNFVLENVDIHLGTDTTRGFILLNSDKKNIAKFENISSNDYSLEFATRLRFEKWLQQTNANIVFVSPSKSWQMYQLQPGWVLQQKITIRGVGIVGGNPYFIDYAKKYNIEVLDWNKYVDCPINGIIETFHKSSGQNLNGKLAKTDNTIVKAYFYGKEIFSPCIYSKGDNCDFEQISGSASASDGYSNEELMSGCPEYWAEIQLNDESTGTEFTTQLISTIYDVKPNIAWLGTLGDKAKMTLFPTAFPNPYVLVEAEIDYAILDLTKNYFIYPRLGIVQKTICSKAIVAGLSASITSFSHVDLNGYSLNDLLAFGGIDSGGGFLPFELTTNRVSSYVGDTINFTTSIRTGIKIICSKDCIIDTADGDVYTNSALIGLTEDDFIAFIPNGIEITTASSFSFDGTTGTISFPFGSSVPIKISFHQSLISDTLSSTSSYTDSLLLGFQSNELILIFDRVEITCLNWAILSGDTYTFSVPGFPLLSGKMKIINVNE